MGERTFVRKAPFATTSFRKGVGVFSRVSVFLGDYGMCKLVYVIPAGFAVASFL